LIICVDLRYIAYSVCNIIFGGLGVGGYKNL
jgi:hypothetical protein